jgi:hypothetical protein
MPTAFPAKTAAAFEATKYLYIRSGDHRLIPIWVVVVDGRVVMRSWNDKESGWYRAFLTDPNGAVRLSSREIAVRAIPLRSQPLNDTADDAYAAKYTANADAQVCSRFQDGSAQGDHA